MAWSPSHRDEQRAGAGGPDVGRIAKRSFITGAAIVLPLAVTIFIVSFLLQFVDNSLDPFIGFLKGVGVETNGVPNGALKLVALGVLLLSTLLVGFVAEFSSRGTRFGDAFDEFMASLPGIGSVYTSFDEMSDILLDSDTDSFQEVKLVEYPVEGAYTVAFKTTESPGVIERATGGDDVVTLFMPMAPNPVMGGFVIHVPADRVVDVDMTVEEGIRSIVTSGVAMDAADDHPASRGLTEREMRRLGRYDVGDRAVGAAAEPSGERRESGTADDDRVAEYDAAVSPEHADTPDGIARRERQRRTDEGPAPPDPADEPPAERAGGDGAHRDRTDGPPAERTGREEATLEPTDGAPAERAEGEDG